MPFFGSVGGNFEAKGIGGYHSGVTPLDNAGVTTSIGSHFATPVSNMQLYIGSATGLVTPSNAALWQTYVSLPAYLSGPGKLTSLSVNETDTATFTLTRPCRAYMLRSTAWNAVDITGWTLNESNTSYISGYGATINVYYKDFAVGTYTYDNNSAMYIFDFTLNGGGLTSSTVVSAPSGSNVAFHINSATGSSTINAGRSAYDPFQMGNLTYSISSGALPTGFSLDTSTGAVTGTYTPAGINTDGTAYTFTIRATDASRGTAQYSERTYTFTQTVPFLYRQIITRNYMVGGYQNGSLWSNANRVLHSNDTSTNLGDGCVDNYHYKSGGCSDNVGYIFNNSAATKFNLRTEAKMTTLSGGAAANNSGSATNADRTKIYTAGEGVGYMQRFTISNETFANIGGASWSGHGCAIQGELIGVWWSTDTSTAKVIFSNETVSSADVRIGQHGQQKGLSGKIGYGYGGAQGDYAGGYTFNKANFANSTTVSSAGTATKPCSNSGEENYGIGQTKGYLVGLYDGAQNNRAGTLVFSTDTATEINGSLSPGGHGGCSSGHCFQRD
jgi:hypothetical protein